MNVNVILSPVDRTDLKGPYLIKMNMIENHLVAGGSSGGDPAAAQQQPGGGQRGDGAPGHQATCWASSLAGAGAGAPQHLHSGIPEQAIRQHNPRFINVF